MSKKAKVSKYGQWKYPGEDTIIPNANGRITMQGVPYPVLGIDDLGNQQMMMPGVDYQFPGNSVYEIPMMSYGGSLPKAQDIGEILYVESKDDPAYITYNDSLDRYNESMRPRLTGKKSFGQYGSYGLRGRNVTDVPLPEGYTVPGPIQPIGQRITRGYYPEYLIMTNPPKPAGKDYRKKTHDIYKEPTRPVVVGQAPAGTQNQKQNSQPVTKPNYNRPNYNIKSTGDAAIDRLNQQLYGPDGLFKLAYGGDISVPDLRRVTITALPKAQTIGELKEQALQREQNRQQARAWDPNELNGAQEVPTDNVVVKPMVIGLPAKTSPKKSKEQIAKEAAVKQDKKAKNDPTLWLLEHPEYMLDADGRPILRSMMEQAAPEELKAADVKQAKEEFVKDLNSDPLQQSLGTASLDNPVTNAAAENYANYKVNNIDPGRASDQLFRGYAAPTTRDFYQPHNVSNTLRGAAGLGATAAGVAGLSYGLAALPALGEAAYAWGAANPFISATGAALTASPAALPGASLANLANAGFITHGVSQLPETYEAWNNAINNGGSYLDATGQTLWNALDFAGVGAVEGFQPAFKYMGEGLSSAVKYPGKLYNEIATGESIIPYAWKSRAMSITPGESKSLFDKIMNSGKFTNADKDLLRNYAVSSWEFKTSSLGKKSLEYQQRMRNLIEKAKVEFPEETILTRKFWMAGKDQPAYLRKESGNYAFDNVKFDKAGNPIEFSLQNRPGSFSAGQIGEGHGNDRIVLSGKNAKAVENNFAKQEYNPTIDPEYYKNLRKEDMIKRENIGINSVYDPMGDLHYGLSRIEPSKIAELAEAKYAQRVANVNTEARVKELTDIGLTKEDALKEVQEWMANNKQLTELYGNPANKEEALAKIIEEARNPKPFNQNMQNELEMIGTGFDMKVVGKVKNDIGGFDYIVKPKNIKAGTNTSTGTTGETLNAAGESSNWGAKRGTNFVKTEHEDLANTIDQLREDRIKFWQTPKGRTRLEAVIENTPELKAGGLTVDDYIAGMRSMTNENRTAVNQLAKADEILSTQERLIDEFENIKFLEQQTGMKSPNGMTEEYLQDELAKLQKQLDDLKIDFENLSVNSRFVDNAFMNRQGAIDLGKSSKSTKVPNPYTKFTTGVGQYYTIADARRVIQHELGHYVQRGVQTNLDKELKSLELLDSEAGNLFNSAKGSSPDTQAYDAIFNKTNEYFKRARKYFKSGGNGQEKLPFLEEVRADMLERGIIKDLGDDITEGMIRQHYANYMMEAHGGKYPLRLYDIMKNNPKNFKLLQSVMNKMPVAVVGAGVGYGMMGGDEETQVLPQKKRGGGIKNPDFLAARNKGIVNSLPKAQTMGETPYVIPEQPYREPRLQRDMEYDEREYYDPMTETIHMRKSYPNVLHEAFVKDHEGAHHIQKLKGKLSSTENWPGPLKEPVIPMSDEAVIDYYNRGMVDVNNLINAVPESTLIGMPDDVIGYGFQLKTYDTPGTTEYEANHFERPPRTLRMYNPIVEQTVDKALSRERQDPEMMFRDKYNTKLTKEEEKEFNKWAEKESKRQGRDILMDKGAYDIQGFWKSGDWKNMDADNHGNDTWKKPNHPTFSNQSKYHGVDGWYGGNWTEEAGYQPSKQTLDTYGFDYYNWLFGEEPNRPEHLDMNRYDGENMGTPIVYKKGGPAKRFNTKLRGQAAEAFNQHAQQFPSLINDAYDYDTKGFYREIYNMNNGDMNAITAALTPGSETAHVGTDRYKKPNHPTFSKESKYYVPILRPAGEWGHNEEDNYDYFNASRRNIRNMTKSDGSPLEYFKRAEDYNQDGIPDVKLFYKDQAMFNQGGNTKRVTIKSLPKNWKTK